MALAFLWYNCEGMVITYLGKQFFKIKLGELTLALNPPSSPSPGGSKSAGESKLTRFGANIAISSVAYPTYSGIERVTYGGTEPFVISGPGEYEIKGIFIKGVGIKTEIEGKRYINTVYVITLDDIKLCFLGAISSPELSADTRELCGMADVLFVPLSGKELSADKAYNLAQSLEPKIIIPMDYEGKKELETFLKEGGEEKKGAIDKLQLKKKDLSDKEAEIIVLSA